MEPLQTAGRRVVLTLLRLVPIWAYTLAAALAWGGWQHHRARVAGVELAQHITQTANLREQAMHAALIETTRRLMAQQEAADAAALQTRQARTAAAAAGSAADKLRAHAARLAASAAACNPTAAASSPADRLAHILGESVDRYREVAAAADRAVIAGQLCERSYGALTR